MIVGTGIFLDTSILIAKFVHCTELKRIIDERLRTYECVVTSLVAKQEFKRRLLKEAAYLLAVLEEEGSIAKVQRRLEQLPVQMNRKFRICLQTIHTIDELDSEEDRTDRLRSYLRSLLKYGMNQVDHLVTHVIEQCGCACARITVRQRKGNGRYEFGTDRCSKTGEGECQVVCFLNDREQEARKIALHLRDKDISEELARAKDFLGVVLNDPAHAKQHDPCLTVGDLLIALESANIPVMYTMNGKESQHLCKALGQGLIVRKPNPIHADILCLADEQDWPEL